MNGWAELRVTGVVYYNVEIMIYYVFVNILSCKSYFFIYKYYSLNTNKNLVKKNFTI